jgi:hypothetical protein
LLTPALLLSHRAVTSRGQIVWYALAYENLVPVVHAATEAGDDALLTLSETQREVWAQLQDNPVSEAVKDTLSHALILRKYMGPDQLQAVVASIAAGSDKRDDTMRLINPMTKKTGYQAACDKRDDTMRLINPETKKTGYDKRDDTMRLINPKTKKTGHDRRSEAIQQKKKKSAPQKEAARHALTTGRLELFMVKLLAPIDVNGKLIDLGYRSLSPHIDFNRSKDNRHEKIKMLEQHITENGPV